jgi:hypothetical protein
MRLSHSGTPRDLDLRQTLDSDVAEDRGGGFDDLLSNPFLLIVDSAGWARTHCSSFRRSKIR